MKDLTEHVIRVTAEGLHEPSGIFERQVLTRAQAPHEAPQPSTPAADGRTCLGFCQPGLWQAHFDPFGESDPNGTVGITHNTKLVSRTRPNGKDAWLDNSLDIAGPDAKGAPSNTKKVSTGVRGLVTFAGMPRTRQSVRDQRNEEARDVGRLLAEAREAAGLSQLQVARLLDVPQSSIAKLELGQRQLRFVEGLRLAALYGVLPSALAPNA